MLMAGVIESSRMEVGSGPGLHLHTREDETFIVLDGEYRFFGRRRMLSLEPSSTCGDPHAISGLLAWSRTDTRRPVAIR